MTFGSITGRADQSRRFTPSLWIYAAIAVIGCMVTVVIVYGYYMGTRLSRLDEPLVDAAREIKMEATETMLRIKDDLKRIPIKEPAALWTEVDNSLWYLKAILDKKGLRADDFKGNETNEIEREISLVQDKLELLKSAVSQRFNNRSFRGTPESYNDAYLSFLATVGSLEDSLIKIRARSLQRFRFVQTFIVLTSIVTFVAIGLFYRRFDRQRTLHLDNLKNSNAELESEMVTRLKAEQALQQTQAQLEDAVSERTSELKLANEALTEQIIRRQGVEQHLITSKAMLQAIFDGILDPLILIDTNTQIKMMNQSALKYYGNKKPEDVIGKLCRQIIDKKCSCDQCQIPLSISKGLTMTFERTGLIDPTRVEQVTVYPVFNHKEAPSEAIIRISDISEQKLLQKRLVLSEKMASLGILVSSIAHEINNPNSFISFNIPILRDYLFGLLPLLDRYAESQPGFELFNMPYEEFKNDLLKMLDNMEHGSQRISAFVNNLREFGESKDLRPHRWVEVGSVIDKAVEICRNKISRSVKSFSVDVAKDLPRIFTEPAALEQILINLLINAAQAADKEASSIQLIARQGPNGSGDLVVEVRDNGCGMDESTLQKIFEPFFTTKALGEGTGLGLYVCQNMAESIGARLEVQSQPGVGSSFMIHIPRGTQRPDKIVVHQEAA